MTGILQGQIIALFAFDLGYEVSLDQLRTLLPAFPAEPLSRKKQTPPYLQYTRTPLRVGLDSSGEFLDRTCQIRLTVFDFGAASLAYVWPIAASDKLSLTNMPVLAQTLYGSGVEQDARERVSRLMKTVSPAISRPELSDIVEDFYVFVFEKLVNPINAEELLADNRSTLAQLLRLEVAPLSATQQADALSTSISYYETDLVIVTWNAAVIFDQDYEDTTNVLELQNIGLLEARYVDAQLDKHIEQYSRIVQKKRISLIPLRSPYRRAIQELADLSIEASLLAERTENALKLVGDLYLARIHRAAAERFHLREWDNIINNKLAIITNIYNLLTDRVRNAQSQALELVIVILILVELLIALFRWGH